MLCVYVTASVFMPGYECGGQKTALGSQLRVWTQVMRSLLAEPTSQPLILFKVSIAELNNQCFRVEKKSGGWGMLKILTALLDFCRAKKKISYERKEASGELGFCNVLPPSHTWQMQDALLRGVDNSENRPHWKQAIFSSIQGRLMCLFVWCGSKKCIKNVIILIHSFKKVIIYT